MTPAELLLLLVAGWIARGRLPPDWWSRLLKEMLP
jgi:hypothetical protein